MKDITDLYGKNLATRTRHKLKVASFLLDLNQAVPNHLADDGPVVYPANAFDSRLRGD